MGNVWKEEDIRNRRVNRTPKKFYTEGDYESDYEEHRPRRSKTLAEKQIEQEKRLRLLERGVETKKKTKQFKFPLKWRFKFRQAKRKNKREMMLVIFLNKKNEIEPPKFMPIFAGNMIVWKNKPYEFDPRAVWTILGMKGNPKAYLIKEIDRRPVRNSKGQVVYKDAAVSNMDLGEIRLRGDSTESDEFLIKAALKAQTAQMKKQANLIAIIIVAILGIGGLLWFMFGGGAG